MARLHNVGQWDGPGTNNPWIRRYISTPVALAIPNRRRSQLAAVETGQHDRPAGVTRGRGDQSVERVGVLDRGPPSERLDDALDMAAALADVLHQIGVFIRPDLLDANEHGAATC